MKALRHVRFGIPAEVAELSNEVEPTSPGRGEVLVRAEALPIHPADLLAMQGRYGTRQPRLPAYCGTDGVGRVVSVGADVDHLRIGDLVPLMFAGVPTWRETLQVDASRLFALPACDPVALSAVGLNALTVWAMLHRVVPLEQGDWIIQNAASSSVGHACFQLAEHGGYRSINVVRSEGAAARAVEAGATHVLVDGPTLAAQVAALTEGRLPRLAIDAVGGAATGRLASCTAAGGVVLNYGMLSGEPCAIESADLVFRQVGLRGFWLKTWLRDQAPPDVARIYGDLVELTRAGVLSAPVAATYPLDGYRDALLHATADVRTGKILFLPGRAATLA
jgi:mitochondrial enoyl-[acyl-carrier protein] reductase / trans-2-enoyl-CoA reductase